MNSIRFSPGVYKDLNPAAKWYRAQGGESLERRFMDAFKSVLPGIAENPFRFPVGYRDCRRAQLTSFPYKVYFKPQPGRVLVVLVVHHARDPEFTMRVLKVRTE